MPRHRQRPQTLSCAPSAWPWSWLQKGSKGTTAVGGRSVGRSRTGAAAATAACWTRTCLLRLGQPRLPLLPQVCLHHIGTLLPLLELRKQRVQVAHGSRWRAAGLVDVVVRRYGQARKGLGSPEVASGWQPARWRLCGCPMR